MATTVLLGNPNPQEQVSHPDPDLAALGQKVGVPHPFLNQSVTRVEMRPDFDDPEHVELTLSTENDRALSNLAKVLGPEHRPYAVGVYEVEQLLAVHSGGVKPDWVASDDPVFAAALGEYFGCPVGEPVMVFANGGRDALHAQFLGTSAQPAAFFYGALSANTGSGFAVTDTTLAGEIATSGGGLIRKAMTYAHTAGTNTSTLTATWTANGSDVLPVMLASWAQFNAVTVGTLGEELALNATATLNVGGDSCTPTFTLTAG
jgi:hypothetical protein